MLPTALPVAVPRPDLALRPDHDDGDDDHRPVIIDEPVDWRLLSAAVSLPWAGFTSMVLSIGTPGPLGIATWFVASGALGLLTWRQRRIFRQWERQERRRLGPTSARSQRVEDRLTAGNVLWVEPALDEDAPGLDGAGAGAGDGVVAEVKLGLADGAARQGQVRAGPDDGGGDDV